MNDEGIQLEQTPTLRDQFAMVAISGYMASGPSYGGYHSAVVAAKNAYEVADAMLKEREKYNITTAVKMAVDSFLPLS